MTQIPDPTMTSDDKTRFEDQRRHSARFQPPYFRIAAEPVRHAAFVNVVNLNFMNGAIFLDFAYADPYQLNEAEYENGLQRAPDGRPIITALPVSRLAVTPESSFALYEMLGDMLTRLRMLPEGSHDELEDRHPTL